MSHLYLSFARKLAAELLLDARFTSSQPGGDPAEVEAKVQVKRGAHEWVELDLQPFDAQPLAPTARQYFTEVDTVDTLLQAYRDAKADFPFEDSLPEAMGHVNSYAQSFMQTIMANAVNTINDQQAALIARWLSNLDVYTAVKSVESLLNSRADLRLLEIAQHNNWSVHFDHLAIRCGSRARHDAERVVAMLKEHYGYRSPQISSEAFYQFPDGWNAYPLYKQLTNGQALRIFVDQSDADHKTQIIQHWNRVYGYTAHHLAIRATQVVEGQRSAVPLVEVMAALSQSGVAILQPTGDYTVGLLEQVFTRPEKNKAIPEALKQDISQYGEQLNAMIENGKLLEIVSRREMPAKLAEEFFSLYGLRYGRDNELHSAPYYQYFLPAQAAHVIRTSVQTQ